MIQYKNYYFKTVHTQITSILGVYIIYIDHIQHTEMLTVHWSFHGIEYVGISFDALGITIDE